MAALPAATSTRQRRRPDLDTVADKALSRLVLAIDVAVPDRADIAVAELDGAAPWTLLPEPAVSLLAPVMHRLPAVAVAPHVETATEGIVALLGADADAPLIATTDPAAALEDHGSPELISSPRPHAYSDATGC